MDNEKLAQALAQLKDIHLPNEISKYPPAPIYFILFFSAAFIFVSIFFYKRYQSKTKNKKYALKQLKEIKLLTLMGDDLNAIQDLSILLRQVALTAFPRENIASLNGADWLEFLDSISSTTEFTNGSGQILATAPFQKQFDDFPEKLIKISERLIKKNL